MDKQLIKEFDTFLTFVYIPKFNKNIRNVFLTYLRWELDEGFENFVSTHISDLEIFFAFLDSIERIQEERKELVLKKKAKGKD
jgi:hypothetical protein